jgi:hypothetical protein
MWGYMPFYWWHCVGKWRRSPWTIHKRRGQNEGICFSSLWLNSEDQVADKPKPEDIPRPWWGVSCGVEYRLKTIYYPRLCSWEPWVISDRSGNPDSEDSWWCDNAAKLFLAKWNQKPRRHQQALFRHNGYVQKLPGNRLICPVVTINEVSYHWHPPQYLAVRFS